jgi:hypothetical protein
MVEGTKRVAWTVGGRTSGGATRGMGGGGGEEMPRKRRRYPTFTTNSAFSFTLCSDAFMRFTRNSTNFSVAGCPDSVISAMGAGGGWGWGGGGVAL